MCHIWSFVGVAISTKVNDISQRSREAVRYDNLVISVNLSVDQKTVDFWPWCFPSYHICHYLTIGIYVGTNIIL